jgi:uncharacterized protein YidB (DUF937 family)
MNKPKIRKSLFIGLGGTGASTLLALKKRFFEVYGHIDKQDGVPRFAQFLAFDTDAPGTRKLNFQNVQNTSLGIERDIRFEPSEVIGVQAPNVKEFIQDEQNQELYNYWMPLGNEKLLKGLNNLDEGAGQVRLFGRLAYHWNARKIATTLQGAINNILLAGNPDEDFEPLEAGGFKPLDVYIVSSLAGGTGSGMFLDVAMKVRQILKEEMTNTGGVQIQGYFVLPDIFSLELSKGEALRVTPNAAGALLDLDFFQGFMPAAYTKDLDGADARLWNPHNRDGLQDPLLQDKDADAITVQYLGGEQTRIVDAPFDQIFLVNNQNANGGTYKKIDDLCASISKGIFASTNEMSTGLRSKDDNTKAGFTFDNKNGWVGSIGVSEMIFSKPEVQKHLSLRALEHGLLELLKDSGDLTSFAQGLMQDLKLIEQGETAEIVNGLMSGVSTPSCFLPEDLFIECSNERQRITNELPDLVKQIVARKSAKETEVLGSLTVGFNKLPANGLAASIASFYEEFDAQLAKCQQELAQDAASAEDALKDELASIQESEDIIKEIASGNMVVRLMKKGELQGEAGEWAECMDRFVKKSLEKTAITAAEEMVSSLRSKCTELTRQYKENCRVLDTLKDKVKEKLASRRAAGQSSYSPNAFTINLHAATMEDEKFITEIDWDLKSLFEELQEIQSESGIDVNKAMKLKTIQNLSGITSQSGGASAVTKWLLENSPTDNEQIEGTLAGSTLMDLLKRSEPLMGMNKAGISADNDRTPLETILKDSTSFLICVPDKPSLDEMEKNLTRLLPDNDFKVVVVPDQQDRVAIFKRQLGAPPVAITGAKRYMRAYEKQHDERAGDVFHVNYHWYDAMKSVNHNLEQGRDRAKERGMRSWMYAILMGDVAYNAANEHWTVKSTRYPGEFKNFTSEKRSEIFAEIKDQNEIVEEFANKWRAVLDREGDSFMAARLQAVLSPPSSSEGGGGDDGALALINYVAQPHINPYCNTGSSENPYGSDYNRHPECLELLHDEMKLLPGLCKEFGLKI